MFLMLPLNLSTCQNAAIPVHQTRVYVIQQQYCGNTVIFNTLVPKLEIKILVVFFVAILACNSCDIDFSRRDAATLKSMAATHILNPQTAVFQKKLTAF